AAVPAIAAMVSVFALGGTAAAAMTGSLPAPLQDFAHHVTGVPAPSRDTGEAPGASTGPVPQQQPEASVRHGAAPTPAERPTDSPSAGLPVPSGRPTGRDGATDDRGSVAPPTADPRPTGGATGQHAAHGSPTAHASGNSTNAGHTAPPTGNGKGVGQAPSGATTRATPGPKATHPAPPSPSQQHTGVTPSTTPGHGKGR
ncbi:MAG: hypothetical protein ACTHJ6_00645, partial [Oryzihumus sp.]